MRKKCCRKEARLRNHQACQGEAVCGHLAFARKSGILQDKRISQATVELLILGYRHIKTNKNLPRDYRK